MNQLRVVLDTNCIVSALLFSRSRLSLLRLCWNKGTFVPLACKETVNELIRVLAYTKFQLDKNDMEQLLADVLPFLEICEVRNPYAKIEGLRDQSDAVFLHLAEQAKADMLVSGDAHILSLHERIPGIRIYRPADFLNSLSYT